MSKAVFFLALLSLLFLISVAEATAKIAKDAKEVTKETTRSYDSGRGSSGHDFPEHDGGEHFEDSDSFSHHDGGEHFEDSDSFSHHPGGYRHYRCPCKCYTDYKKNFAYKECRRHRYRHCRVLGCYRYHRGLQCCDDVPPPRPCPCTCTSYWFANKKCRHHPHCKVSGCYSRKTTYSSGYDGGHHSWRQYQCCDH